MKVFGFAGWSGSGKTTLIERVIPEITARGLRVSVIKHAHHGFDVDKPGKDSWRHREAGAGEILLVSDERWVLMHEMRGAPEPVLAGGEAREAEREAFFAATEARFAKHLAALQAGADPRADWLDDLRMQALRQFDALAVPGIDQRETDQIERIVTARKFLGLAFAGYGKQGRAIYEALQLPVPDKKGKAA